MRAVWRDPGPRAGRPATAGKSDGQLHGHVEPADECTGEPGADVLHDHDRDRVAGRECLQQSGQDLRSSGRCADADHRCPADKAATTKPELEPSPQMADHMCPAEYPDPPPEG